MFVDYPEHLVVAVNQTSDIVPRWLALEAGEEEVLGHTSMLLRNLSARAIHGDTEMMSDTHPESMSVTGYKAIWIYELNELCFGRKKVSWLMSMNLRGREKGCEEHNMQCSIGPRESARYARITTGITDSVEWLDDYE